MLKFVNLVEIEALGTVPLNTLVNPAPSPVNPLAVTAPFMFNEPVNLCRSSDEFPNIVLPLVNIIEALSISV